MRLPESSATCREAMPFDWPLSRAMAGVASTAAAISTTEVSFDLVIQFLHSMYQANNVWLVQRNGKENDRSKERFITCVQRRVKSLFGSVARS
jgi:hypothetical protein